MLQLKKKNQEYLEVVIKQNNILKCMGTVWTRAVKVRFGVGILILQASGHCYQL